MMKRNGWKMMFATLALAGLMAAPQLACADIAHDIAAGKNAAMVAQQAVKNGMSPVSAALAAVKADPQSAVAVAVAVAQDNPDAVVDIATAVAKAQPEQAVEIVRALAAMYPDKAEGIVQAVTALYPSLANDIAAAGNTESSGSLPSSIAGSGGGGISLGLDNTSLGGSTASGNDSGRASGI